MRNITAFFISAALVTAFANGTLAQTPVAPAAGDIAVSEIMFNPGPEACVTDNNGEYFEITNISCKVLDLNGIFIQDATITAGVPAPTGVFFRVHPSVATLPSLYPGQRFLFCRKNDPLVNGGLSNVDYWYAAPAAAPADNSQIGSTSMNLNNGSTGDGLFITVGGPAIVPSPNPNGYVAGTVIESVSYIATAAPFLLSGSATAGERIDLFAPMQIGGGANSANLAVSTTVNSTGCAPDTTYVGTPRLRNSVDTTSWPVNVNYDSLNFPNSGVFNAVTPLSIGAGSAEFVLSGGPAGFPYYVGYADNTNGASEFPISLFVPGQLGSINIDLFTASYLSGFTFNGSGGDSLVLPLPNDNALIALKFELQWLAVDGLANFVLSNGIRVEVCP